MTFSGTTSYVGITGKPFSGTVEQVEAQVRKEELNVASMLLTKDKLEPSDIENWRKNKTAYIKYFFCLLLPLSFVFFFTLGGGGVILAIIISWFLSRLFVKARHR